MTDDIRCRLNEGQAGWLWRGSMTKSGTGRLPDLFRCKCCQSINSYAQCFDVRLKPRELQHE
jgi:hypothetical protein